MITALLSPLLERTAVKAVNLQTSRLGAIMKPSVLVLIAEDEPDIRLVLQASFEDGGFEVLLASNLKFPAFYVVVCRE